MKTNSIGEFFTIEKILKIDLQNFRISWNASESISWTFLGSLHFETIVKYVFHEILWKKYFTVYSHLKRTLDDPWKLATEVRSSRPEVFCKKVFLEISQNSQENACAKASFLMRLQATFFYRTPLDDCFWEVKLEFSSFLSLEQSAVWCLFLQRKQEIFDLHSFATWDGFKQVKQSSFLYMLYVLVIL